MKNESFYRDQNQKPGGALRPAEAGVLNQNKADFPSAEHVARKAYFTFLNEGGVHGRHEHHWLQAEALLIDERNQTRTHGHALQ